MYNILYSCFSPRGMFVFTLRDHSDKVINFKRIIEIHQDLQHIDTVEDLFDAVKEAFSECFVSKYWTNHDGERQISWYSKIRSETFKTSVDGNTIMKKMSEHIGIDILDWFGKLLGNNKLYLEGTENLCSSESHSLRRVRVEFLLIDILMKIISKTEYREI